MIFLTNFYVGTLSIKCIVLSKSMVQIELELSKKKGENSKDGENHRLL